MGNPTIAPALKKSDQESSRCWRSAKYFATARMRISFTQSGRWRYMMDMMIVLMHTDLPEPVVPAMSKWGIVARSTTNAAPDT